METTTETAAVDPTNGNAEAVAPVEPAKEEEPTSVAADEADNDEDRTKVVFSARELFFTIQICETLPPTDKTESRAAGDVSDALCEGADWDYLDMVEAGGLSHYVEPEQQRKKLYSIELSKNQARTAKARLERAVEMADKLNSSTRLCNEYLDIAERLGAFIESYPKKK